MWCYRLVHKGVKVDKISGSDYLPKIIERCLKRQKRIFFLGGAEIPTKNLVDNINFRFSGLAAYFCGEIEAYPFSEQSQKIIAEHIKEFKPEVLIVSYGAPKQEFWISDNSGWMKEVGIRAAYGLGGSVDMMFTPRLKAPTIVSRLGLEIIWRIIAQPLDKKRWKRLFYSVGFFKYIFSSKF
jgi:N-acetylglucosaminyldiphosphoundecaprenol N-acetyl-beta-D-mannosaminyltransferase